VERDLQPSPRLRLNGRTRFQDSRIAKTRPEAAFHLDLVPELPRFRAFVLFADFVWGE